MIAVLAFVAGAIYGGLQARRRKGEPFDVAQWAAVYGIVFGLAGLILTIVLGRIA